MGSGPSFFFFFFLPRPWAMKEEDYVTPRTLFEGVTSPPPFLCQTMLYTCYG